MVTPVGILIIWAGPGLYAMRSNYQEEVHVLILRKLRLDPAIATFEDMGKALRGKGYAVYEVEGESSDFSLRQVYPEVHQ